MKVVSNTSPLCYLLLIDQINLLPQLFGEVNVPQAVPFELSHTSAPEAVRKWIASPPLWLKPHRVATVSEPTLQRLHQGEQEAILLAQDISADLLIMDEKAGRQAAALRSLNVTGLLGILDQGAARGMIDLSDAVARLQQENFRVSPRLLKTLLEKHNLL